MSQFPGIHRNYQTRRNTLWKDITSVFLVHTVCEQAFIFHICQLIEASEIMTRGRDEDRLSLREPEALLRVRGEPVPHQLMGSCTRQPLDKKCETGVLKNRQVSVTTHLAQNTSTSMGIEWFRAVTDVSCVGTQHICIRSISEKLYLHEFNRKSSGRSPSASAGGNCAIRGRDWRRTLTRDADAAAMAFRTSLCVSIEAPMPAA